MSQLTNARLRGWTLTALSAVRILRGTGKSLEFAKILGRPGYGLTDLLVDADPAGGRCTSSADAACYKRPQLQTVALKKISTQSLNVRLRPPRLLVVFLPLRSLLEGPLGRQLLVVFLPLRFLLEGPLSGHFDPCLSPTAGRPSLELDVGPRTFHGPTPFIETTKRRKHGSLRRV